MKLTGIPEAILKKIEKHAEEAYPSECCGVLLTKETDGRTEFRFRPCRNIQDECHEKDPHQFPRTSRTAYWMDPRDILAIEKEKRANGETLSVIYHSHIDAEAVFSAEDKRLALSEGRPVYENAAYLVLAVYKGKVHNAHIYHWREMQKEFVA